MIFRQKHYFSRHFLRGSNRRSFDFLRFRTGRRSTDRFCVDHSDYVRAELGDRGRSIRYRSIRVSNTGPGISPTNQNKVFDRFFRADFSRTRKHESFGLGLPLAREIAKAHGGNIVLVASNSEKTTFEFKLPTDKLK